MSSVFQINHPLILWLDFHHTLIVIDHYLSETLALNITLDETDTDGPNESLPSVKPFAACGPSSSRAKTSGPKPPKSKKVLCPVCSRGFQFKRTPATHTTCSKCETNYHKKCVKLSFGGGKHFKCKSCIDKEEVAVTIEVPVHVNETCQQSSCTELLLVEDDVIVSTKPSYLNDMDKFNQRMSELGFKRSPTQEVTKGDGDCALWAIIDQVP